jgi:hypothetical protein
MARKLIWATTTAVFVAVLTGLLLRHYTWMPALAGSAALVAAYLGWREASIANVHEAVEMVNRLGGVEALLDRQGREMLTLWIPLDHDLTERDRKAAKKLAREFEAAQSPKVARYCALESSLKEVGLIFIGKETGEMIATIRSYYQSRCPRGSYITRRYIGDDDSESFWPKPTPLFEDDRLERFE